MQHNILDRTIIGNFHQKSIIFSLNFPKKIDLNVLLLLCGTMLFPVIPITSMNFRVSDFVALIIIPMLILSYSRTIKSKNIFHLIFIICTFFFSTLFGYLFLDVPVSIRDFNELFRMAIPLLTYWVAVNIETYNLKNSIHLFFYIASPLIAGFGLIQFFSPHSIPLSILSLYGGDNHVNMILTRSQPRIFATGSDPNIGCVILILFLFYHVSRFILQKKLSSFCFTIVFLILISFTASRTGIISLLFTFVVFSLFSRNIKLFTKVMFLIICFNFIWFVWMSSDYVRNGFLLLSVGENGSWLNRLENFEEAITLFKLSPVFGWGPAKATHNIVVDGEYFLLIRRYGIVGFLCLISFFIRATCFAFYQFNKIDLQKHKIILLTFLLYSISIFIIMVSNNFFSGYQLSVPYMILLGYIEKAYQETNSLLC